jgi:hypothetical protein
MQTDLEADIRDALQARAQRVTADSVRYADAPREQRVSHRAGWSMLAVAALVAALTVIIAIRPWQTDHHEVASGAHVPAVNTSWQLVRAYSPSGGIASGAGLRASLTFTPNRHLLGDDGISAIDATFIETADGFRVSAIATSGNGYAGHNRRVLAVKSAMDALFNDADGGPVDVTSSLHGDRLTLQVSGYTLQFRRLD